MLTAVRGILYCNSPNEELRTESPLNVYIASGSECLKGFWNPHGFSQVPPPPPPPPQLLFNPTQYMALWHCSIGFNKLLLNLGCYLTLTLLVSFVES